MQKVLLVLFLSLGAPALISAQHNLQLMAHLPYVACRRPDPVCLRP